MAERRPLVNVSGRTQELPVGDQTVTLVKGGFIVRDLAVGTGAQAVTGLGFRPAFVLLYLSGAGRVSFGWSIGGPYDEAHHGCVYRRNPGATTEWASEIDGGVINTGPADFYLVRATSMDTDGFTLSWTRLGSPTGSASLRWVAHASS